MTTTPTGLSAEITKAGRLQRALLERLREHEREGMLPTSGRFLFYELVQAGVVSKARTGARRADQDTLDALTQLREAELVPWDWIVDETRELTEWQTAATILDYVLDAVKRATLNPWGDGPAPLILCESRSLAGVLNGTASRYACPITSSNGQARGFLITQVAPTLKVGQRVLYLGDWDHCGHQIEAANRRTLIEHSVWVGEDEDGESLWERVALTTEQVEEFDLPVIQKRDRRYSGAQYFDAVETEALGQARIVGLLTARLDELMPEPLADVQERGRVQRAKVTEVLRRIDFTE